MDNKFKISYFSAITFAIIAIPMLIFSILLDLYKDNLILTYINVTFILIGFILSLGIAYGYILISNKNKLKTLKIMSIIIIIQSFIISIFNIYFLFVLKTPQIINLNYAGIITIGIIQIIFGIYLFKSYLKINNLTKKIGILYTINGILFLTIIFGLFSYFISLVISIYEAKLFLNFSKEEN